MSNKKREGLGLGEWLQSQFAPAENPRYVIVEVDKAAPTTREDLKAIATLKHHPGFLALIRKLNFMKAALRSQLEQRRYGTLRDYDSIQLGLYWLGILEHEVVAADAAVSQGSTRAATQEEVTEFEKISAAIERIGHTSPEEK